MDELRESWVGKTKLWKVFWLYNFILGSALIYAMDYAARIGGVVEILVAIVVLVWSIWIAVSMWRCAFNVKWKVWGYLTRGLMLVCAAYLLLILVGPFIGIATGAA